MAHKQSIINVSVIDNALSDDDGATSDSSMDNNHQMQQQIDFSISESKPLPDEPTDDDIEDDNIKEKSPVPNAKQLLELIEDDQDPQNNEDNLGGSFPINADPPPVQLSDNDDDQKVYEEPKTHKRILSAFQETPGSNDMPSDSEELFIDSNQTPGMPIIRQGSTQNKYGEIVPDDEFHEIENDPNKISFAKWLSQYGLDHFYKTFLQIGFDNVKMFTKCTDSNIAEIAKQLKANNMNCKEGELAIQLKLKTAITDLQHDDFKRSLLMTVQEKQSIEDMDKKIASTQETTLEFTKLFENIATEKYTLEQEIDNKFDGIIEILLQRKRVLLDDIDKCINNKKMILNTKIESLLSFQTTLNEYKINCLSLLNTVSKNERKDKIIEIHQECTKKYIYTVEKTQVGVPQIGLSMNTGDIINGIGTYGQVIEKINDTMRMIPILDIVTNNGKDNVVGVNWKLGTNFVGVDKELISNIKIEWLQIDQFKDDDEIKEDYNAIYDEQEIENEVNQYIKNNDVKLSKKWSSKSFILDDINTTEIYQHSINTRRQGLFIIRLKLMGNHKDNFILSTMQYIKIFRKRFNYIQDQWDANTKNKELKIGVFNKHTLTRSVPGNWKNCFGTFCIQKGVNIWTLKIKKKDNDRKFISVMFGVIKESNASKWKINGCFAYGNGDNNDGYGFYAANGCIYHGSKYGQPYIQNYQLKNNDIICIIVDYYKGTIVFDITPSNNNKQNIIINGGQQKLAFYIDRKTKYKLAVSMRGCDEIQLVDV